MPDVTLLRQSLMTHEGYRSRPYTDTNGNLTIGYGRNLLMGISNDEALYMLENDMEAAIHTASVQLWWPNVSGNDARANALCEMIFNLGLGKFNTFVHAIGCLLNNDFLGAAANFLNSLWAKQVGQRAIDLCKQIETGNFLDASGQQAEQ